MLTNFNVSFFIHYSFLQINFFSRKLFFSISIHFMLHSFMFSMNMVCMYISVFSIVTSELKRKTSNPIFISLMHPSKGIRQRGTAHKNSAGWVLVILYMMEIRRRNKPWNGIKHNEGNEREEKNCDI